MDGIISQLLCQEQVTRDQINKVAWFMAESREWVVARDWGTLVDFRDKINPFTLKES